MNTDFIINLATMFSVLVAIAFIVSAIRHTRKDALRMGKPQGIATSEYDKILFRTRKLEFEREKNTGTHYADESVYVNRAEHIRRSSSFFAWTNKKS